MWGEGLAIFAFAVSLACGSEVDVDSGPDGSGPPSDGNGNGNDLPDAGADGTDVDADDPPDDTGAGLVFVGGDLDLGPGDEESDSAETWLWNGQTWGRADSPLGAPSYRYKHAMAYDPDRSEVVLFSGLEDEGFFGNTLADDTWTWDSTGWNFFDTETDGPDPRSEHAMAYDGERVMMFGGFAEPPFGGGQTARAETWIWDDGAWTELTPSEAPAPRYAHQLAYDESRGEVVLFGGRVQEAEFALPGDDTWVWDGSNWEELSPSDAPDPRSDHAMAYDSGRGVVVLFGGRGTGDTFDDTWEWDGSTWDRMEHPGLPPTPRAGHAMAYDPHTRRVIMVAGERDDGDALSDRWAWNGALWEEISRPGSVDPARSHADLSRGPVPAN